MSLNDITRSTVPSAVVRPKPFVIVSKWKININRELAVRGSPVERSAIPEKAKKKTFEIKSLTTTAIALDDWKINNNQRQREMWFRAYHTLANERRAMIVRLLIKIFGFVFGRGFFFVVLCLFRSWEFSQLNWAISRRPWHNHESVSAHRKF